MQTTDSITDSSTTAQGWILYDASCGICSRWVPFWSSTLRRAGLGTAPLQAPWVQARLHLPPAESLKDIRILLNNNRHLAGPDVYRYVMRRTWWAYPLYLLTITPLLRLLFNRAYRTFANHRHQLSTACRLPPSPVQSEKKQ